MSLQPGDRIGDYEIVGTLGAGGMGKVYKVRNIISNRVEALKVLLPDLTGNREVAERFLSEIRVLAAFDHPNIAELRTAQRDGQQLLMVMELIEGESLDRVLRSGPVPRAQMLEVLARVLDALEYAHARGVVHRDIKPSNIMLTREGKVKLMDFGIAKRADRQLTAAGTTLGSVYYMSPEQIQGSENVDARSDVYSLGVVMYEMVTGKKPFEGSSEFSLMSAHLNEAPHPPSAIDASIPESVSRAVLKALAKDPAERFQSAAEMRSAVEALRPALIGAVAAAEPAPGPAPRTAMAAAPAPAAPPSSRRTLWVAAGSVATVAVLAASAFVIPKFFATEATGEPPRPAMQEPAPTPPQAAPEQTPPAGEPAAQAPSTPSSAPTQARVPDNRPASGQSSAQPVRTPAPAEPAVARPEPAQQSSAPVEPPTREQSPAPANPPPGPSRAELNAVREEYNNLAIRAGTVKTGLQNLQNQMGGLSLRADMRELSTRLDYLMQEAMSSLKSGDVEGARRSLTMADRTAERLEKFLSGR